MRSRRVKRLVLTPAQGPVFPLWSTLELVAIASTRSRSPSCCGRRCDGRPRCCGGLRLQRRWFSWPWAASQPRRGAPTACRSSASGLSLLPSRFVVAPAALAAVAMPGAPPASAGGTVARGSSGWVASQGLVGSWPACRPSGSSAWDDHDQLARGGVGPAWPMAVHWRVGRDGDARGPRIPAVVACLMAAPKAARPHRCGPTGYCRARRDRDWRGCWGRLAGLPPWLCRRL